MSMLSNVLNINTKNINSQYKKYELNKGFSFCNLDFKIRYLLLSVCYIYIKGKITSNNHLLILIVKETKRGIIYGVVIYI